MSSHLISSHLFSAFFTSSHLIPSHVFSPLLSTSQLITTVSSLLMSPELFSSLIISSQLFSGLHSSSQLFSALRSSCQLILCLLIPLLSSSHTSLADLSSCQPSRLISALLSALSNHLSSSLAQNLLHAFHREDLTQRTFTHSKLFAQRSLYTQKL